MEGKRRLRIAMPAKLQVNVVTVTNLLNTLYNQDDFYIDVRFMPGKSNIDQARSMLITEWFDESGEDDLFLFIDSDQLFSYDDIKALVDLNADVACGIYKSLADYPCCKPVDEKKFITGEDNNLYCGATGFMLIRKPILRKVLTIIELENAGIVRYHVSNDFPNVIPFFNQRLIQTDSLNKRGQWLGEDYAFCWMVKKVGGSIKGHISKSIGHQVPQIVTYYPPEYKSKVWDEKTIVYYTGNSRLKWSPKDILTKGLGGSETAVIKLSKFWSAFGYKVHVYGNCEECIYDGVNYINFTKFQTNDKFNILILWRSYGCTVIGEVNAKQIIIDLHDKPSSSYNILGTYFNKINTIVCKSNFHKNLFNEVFRNKIKTIPNGVPGHYLQLDYGGIDKKLKENRHKLIYSSSYDRGLYEMLKWGFPIIKKEIPEAELHIYYGMELLPEKFKEILIPLLKQEGVYEHGRISQEELLEKKKESSIHYYIGCLLETDCITVKEAVCAGCIPVVNNFNVFTERDYCLKVIGGPLEEETHTKAAHLIVKLMKDDEYYKKIHKKIQDRKIGIDSWENTSKKWKELFIN